jgi:transcriptional regulator with XRE-family HTH domain
MTKTYLESITAEPEQMRLYQEERLIVAVTELVCKELAARGMKQADLAAALQKSPGRVSQYLAGERNLTLRTVADIFTALGLRLKVDAEPMNASHRAGHFISACLTQQWERASWKVSTPDAGDGCPLSMAG